MIHVAESYLPSYQGFFAHYPDFILVDLLEILSSYQDFKGIYHDPCR